VTSDPGLVFGEVARAYERARPDYPPAAARWLVGSGGIVLELGAGTGKLTRHLVGDGHEVLATDPDERMLAVLRELAPKARTQVGSAEEINLPDRSIDVIAVAQALHWFDLDRALPEMARVLRSDGVVAAVWNQRDASIPWVAKLERLLGRQDSDFDPQGFIEADERLHLVDAQEFRHWQVLDRDQLAQFVNSRSEIVVLPPAARAERVNAVLALYDEYDRGGGLRMPWISRCFRVRLRLADAVEPATDVPDDDGTLLIDFK